MVLGAVAVCGLGLLLGLRPADPSRADPAAAAAYRQQLSATAGEADAAIRRLDDDLRAALESARQGAADTVSGDEPPGPRLVAAADQIEALGDRLHAARAALGRVSSLLAIHGETDAPRLSLGTGDLAAIGQELRGTAAPSDDFAAMRRSSQAVLAELRAALIATDAGHAMVALAAVTAGEQRLAEVRAYDEQLVTLPVWAETSGALFAALRDLARARVDHDVEGERTALRSYARAAASAAQADRGLAIALAEGGAAIARSPLGGLADALAQIEDARAALAPLLHQE